MVQETVLPGGGEALHSVQALDALITLVVELNEAISPVVRDLSLIANLPMLILVQLGTREGRSRRDLDIMLSALGVDGNETIDMLEERGLIAHQLEEGSVVDSGGDFLVLSASGAELVRRIARVFYTSLREIGGTVEHLAGLLDS